MRPIPEDVVRRIERDFGASQVKDVASRLAFLDCELVIEQRERLLRCIVFLASGDSQELDSCIDLCRRDWRVLIMNAEYERNADRRRLHDFSQPFD